MEARDYVFTRNGLEHGALPHAHLLASKCFIRLEAEDGIEYLGLKKYTMAIKFRKLSEVLFSYKYVYTPPSFKHNNYI